MCGLTRSGAAWCWGANGLGQLGRWEQDTIPRAVRVPSRIAFTVLTAGDTHTCGLSGSKEVWCWGDQWDGSTGTLPTGETVREPASVRTRLRFASIAAGARHTCAVTSAALPMCWGNNSTGAVRSGKWRTYFSPVAVPGVRAVKRVFAGPSASCVVGTGGGVQCWGASTEQLTAPGPTYGTASVAVGDAEACAVNDAGLAFCWTFAPRPDSVAASEVTVDTVAAMGRPVTRLRGIVARNSRYCAIDESARLWCWHAGASNAARVVHAVVAN